MICHSGCSVLQECVPGSEHEKRRNKRDSAFRGVVRLAPFHKAIMTRAMGQDDVAAATNALRITPRFSEQQGSPALRSKGLAREPVDLQ